jgi:hypothetical protein
LTNVSIGGSLTGQGLRSGLVFAGDDMGGIAIAGNFHGGNGTGAGRIFGLGDIASIRIGGSLVGGRFDSTGEIRANGVLGALRIKGSLIGGDPRTNNSLEGAGYVQAERIDSVQVGGSIIAGRNNNADPVTHFLKKSGTIRSQTSIGRLDVLGSLIGNSTNPVIVSAYGAPNPVAPKDVAIGSIKVGGRVEWTSILAGYDTDLNAVNADAQIGAVTVGHDWIASNLVAGAFDEDGDGFGIGDVLINEADDDPEIQARIGSVVIGGQALGTVGGADQFGIVAELIGSCKIGGLLIPLTAGPNNDDIALGTTGDLRLVELDV